MYFHSHALRWLVVALLAVALLPAPVLAGRARENENGKLNGLYQATVMNKTKDTKVEDMEVEVEDKFIYLRFPAGTLKLRIDDIYDRAYQLEFTGRDKETGDLYIIQVDK